MGWKKLYASEHEAVNEWSKKYRLKSEKKEYAALIYSIVEKGETVYHCGRTFSGMGKLGPIRPNVVVQFLYLYFLESWVNWLKDRSKIIAFVHTHPKPPSGWTYRAHSKEDLWLLRLPGITAVYVIPFEDNQIHIERQCTRLKYPLKCKVHKKGDIKMLKPGDQAPDFTLKNEQDQKISLSDFRGKKVVLYFYPKDNTPGCTKEACSFRDVYDDILEAGAVVIGISKDSVLAHQKFKEKYQLPFYLLSDPEHRVIEVYGAWKQKKMFGKSFMGIVRSTFIIDENGTILKVYPKIKLNEHGEEVLKALRG